MEINEDGPVQAAYIDGMQAVLDKQSGKAGAVKVLSVHASPSGGVMLLQQSIEGTRDGATSNSVPLEGTSQLPPILLQGTSNQVHLVYTLTEKKHSKGTNFKLHQVAGDLDAAVQKAAKSHTKWKKGVHVPKLLKEVASGTRSAAGKASAEVKVKPSLRCEATHQLNVDIRAGARVVISKHEEVLEELEH